jgi:hypothetical protein
VALTAVATAIAAIAALLTARFAYNSLTLQERLSRPSESTITLAGSDLRVTCPSVSQAAAMFQGTATMQRNEKLWVLLSAPGVGLIYIPSRSPSPLDNNKNWSQAISGIGDKNSGGANFEVLAVAADASASAFLSRTVNGPDESPSVKAIPAGAYVIASQCITRA